MLLTGYRPSPISKLGLGPLRGLELAAGPLPEAAFNQLPDPLDQLFQDCVANSGVICLGHAMAAALGNANGPWPELASRAFLYALLRVRSGGTLKMDDGGYIHAMVEAVQDHGFPKESQWSYGPEHLDMWPSWEAFRDAADQQVIQGARRIVSMGYRRVMDVATAIAGGAVVQLGTLIDQDFMRLGANDVYRVSKKESGHAMVAHAYRRRGGITGRFDFALRSSWGRQFADGGSAWVDEDIIASAETADCWIWETLPSFSGTT